MGSAYIYEAIRTPRGRGRADGALHIVRPVDLLAGLLRDLEARSGLHTAEVDDVVMGCVTQTGEQGACIARFAALAAGWDHDAPGVTLNRFCGSGLEAVNHAAAMVASGFHDLVVAGGVESMSRVAMGSDGGAIWDARTQTQVGSVPQGISADLIATREGFSRLDVDSFAVESQRRCAEALSRNAFARSLCPVKDESGLVILAEDELPRPGTSLDALAKLKPAFQTMGVSFGLDQLVRRPYPEVERVEHVHHAGNSSGIVDGAAAVLVGSAAVGERYGWRPRARIRSVGLAGAEPVIMLTGPVPAAERALKKAGMSALDVDLYEVNEAFAVVPLYFSKKLGVPLDRINVNGGAIALGHPLGATGAMLLGTALDELERRDLSTALITLCIGGGMGIATIIERI
jgi:acetyl-CoA C-acetyltransferase